MVGEITVATWPFQYVGGSCNHFLLVLDEDGAAQWDGCHSTAQDVAEAKRLYESIGVIYKPNRRYVMVMLQEVPEHRGEVNKDAIATLNENL